MVIVEVSVLMTQTVVEKRELISFHCNLCTWEPFSSVPIFPVVCVHRTSAHCPSLHVLF